MGPQCPICPRRSARPPTDGEELRPWRPPPDTDPLWWWRTARRRRRFGPWSSARHGRIACAQVRDHRLVRPQCTLGLHAQPTVSSGSAGVPAALLDRPLGPDRRHWNGLTEHACKESFAYAVDEAIIIPLTSTTLVNYLSMLVSSLGRQVSRLPPRRRRLALSP